MVLLGAARAGSVVMDIGSASIQHGSLLPQFAQNEAIVLPAALRVPRFADQWPD
jgi:hypothetical protein